MIFGKEFFWVPMTEEISGIQVRCGIWVFRKPPKLDEYYLQGLSTTGINELLSAAKFYKLTENPEIIVRVVDSILTVQSLSDIKEFLKEYLKNIPEEGIDLGVVPGYASKLDLQEKYYRQYNLTFNKNYLEHLDPLPLPILSDGPDVSYVPFLNTIVEIKKEGIRTIGYRELNTHVVWKDQIIQRPFSGICEHSKSHFVKFLMNITENDEKRFSGFKSALGYLMHHYSSPSKGQAVLFYDQQITNFRHPQGGTGKGLIAQALSQIRKVTKIDGKHYKPEDKFKFQRVELSTQIVWIDDPKANFDFSDLFSCLTDGLTIEKKHMQSILCPPEKSPKFLIPSNSILGNEGSSNKRRQFPLELSDYYSKQIIKGDEEPIMQEHGCIFFDRQDWNPHEWDMFYSYMIGSILFYFQNGLVHVEPLNVAANRLAQLTTDEFYEWSMAKEFETGVIYNTGDLFAEFRNTYFGEDSNLKQRWFTNQLKEFASFKGWKHLVKRTNGKQQFEFTVA